MRVVLLLVALAGCDRLFNLEPIEPIDHIDAGTAGDAFDGVNCPSSYTLALWPNARFRIVEATYVKAWEANDMCNADLAGVTHLATAPTRAKLDALIGALVARQGGWWWLGAVQPVSVTTPIADWLWVTGEPIDPAIWSTPDEPNDEDGDELGHEEQFGFIHEQTPGGLLDLGGDTRLSALCECDGRPISEAARIAIEQSRLP